MSATPERPIDIYAFRFDRQCIDRFVKQHGDVSWCRDGWRIWEIIHAASYKEKFSVPGGRPAAPDVRDFNCASHALAFQISK